MSIGQRAKVVVTNHGDYFSENKGEGLKYCRGLIECNIECKITIEYTSSDITVEKETGNCFIPKQQKAFFQNIAIKPGFEAD